MRQPSSSYIRDPWFWLKYDLTWFAVLAAAVALLQGLQWPGLSLAWGFYLIPLVLVVAYLQMMANVFVHNCVHHNWPRPINRAVGELAGAFAMMRYASWEILHRRHHMHSDDVEKDPHPMELSFWGFFWNKMILNLEQNLHQQYFELWGETPALRRRELFRSIVSAATGLMLFLFWLVLLGPVAFLGVFLPGLVIGVLHLSHFNWATHNAHRAETAADFRPVNLDYGIFWLGNRLLFGSYMHANHHAYASMFNPMKLDAARTARAEQKVVRAMERLAS